MRRTSNSRSDNLPSSHSRGNDCDESQTFLSQSQYRLAKVNDTD